jgi:phosphoglycolate phosphatase
LIRKKIALLWDIDGTLLTTNGLGRTPLLEAIRITTGVVGSYSLDSTSGLTDHQVVNKVLTEYFFQDEDIDSTISKVLDLYCDLYASLVINKSFMLLNEIDQIMEELSRNKNFLNLICTGNVIGGAKLKLRKVGLDHFFKEQYLFCSQNLNPRSSIVSRAKDESLRMGYTPVVIGDTIHDVEAARVNGLQVIALESENYPVDVLRNSNPDSVLQLGWQLQDLERALNGG